VLRFETIIEEPCRAIDRLAERLNLAPLYETPYLPEEAEYGSRWADYWRRLTRNFESTAVVGRPNGKPRPDWEEAFTEEDRRLFWREAGEMLAELGYETDDTWVKDPGHESLL